MAPGCRVVCTCSPCTDHDFDACLDQAEKAQDDAVKQGCAETFDTFVTCFEDNARCQGTPSATTDECSRAARNLRVCADAGNPFATVCEEAQAKISACFPGQNPGQTNACSGSTACNAACVLATTCEALNGQVFDQAFNDCVNRCSGITPDGQPPPL